jgi:4-amino-4-deoxy-L-arabinose transferase-like glycosyltransferase
MGRHAEVAVIVTILFVAFALRLVHLQTLPAGFHGDEAVVGLESQRILRDGNIGPYSPYAAGQPTGPIYVSALSVGLLGNSVLAVRIVSAVVGAATVLLLYLVLRRLFSVEVAVVGASLLAVMSWHLHFSRIAYPLIFWPLTAVLIGVAINEALRTARLAWWLAAGALIGGGIYVYNAHPLLAVASAVVIGLWLAFKDRGRSIPRHARGLAAAVLAAVVVAVPMMRYAQDDSTRYSSHFDEASMFGRPEWTELETRQEQASFILSQYGGFWTRICCSPELDVVDATGLVPVLPLSLLVLSAIGLPVALRRYRLPIVWFGAAVIVMMPLSTILTEGGVARRTFVIAPFLAMFAAIGLVAGFAYVQQHGRVTRAIATVLLAGAFGLVSFQSLQIYFGEFAEANVEERALALPIADAAKFIDALPQDHYVYFLSNTWSFDYATREFLAPDRRGEDRSREFGRLSLAVNERRGVPVFVLLGHYMADIDEIRERYPNGELLSGDEENPTFIAYRPTPP